MNQLLFTFLVIAVGGAMSANITIGAGSGWNLGVNYPTVNANVGDSALFFYSSSHAVAKFADGTSYTNCDFSSATTLATQSQGGGSGGFQNLYVYTVPAGVSYIACPISGHCGAGMKVTITTDNMAVYGFSEEEIFSVANAIPLVGWIFLIAMPRYSNTKTIVVTIALLEAVIYAIIFAYATSEGKMNMNDFRSLDGVANLFSNRTALLAGWVHYLSFDLWVGLWIVTDSQSRVPHPWIVLPLILTLVAGPCGLLSYFSVRTLYIATKQQEERIAKRR